MSPTENKRTADYKKLRQNFRQLVRQSSANPENKDLSLKAELIRQELTLQLLEDMRLQSALTNDQLMKSKTNLESMASKQQTMQKASMVAIAGTACVAVIMLLSMLTMTVQSVKNINATNHILESISDSHEMNSAVTLSELKALNKSIEALTSK